MKTNYFLAVLFSLAMLNTNAQFYDDFEDCTPGLPMPGDHWGCDMFCGIICVSGSECHSGTHCGLIPDDGTSDAVLDLGNKIFSEWDLSFWMYVPSNKEAYWNLQGEVPVGAGEWIVGNVFFNQDNANPGVGLIDDSALGPVNFNFPHDEWFRIVMSWDITAGISHATWYCYIDGEEVLPIGTPFTNQAGDIPTSLGGFDFFSISLDNLYYLDDFDFCEPFQGNSCFLDVKDHTKKEIIIYPNPIDDLLNLSAVEKIDSVSISNLLGQVLYQANVDNLETTIDLSVFSAGTYFIKIQIGDAIVTKKIIKE